MLDIDFFKRVNDTYGHQFGDRVLQKVANTITESIRENDSVGRYGGEEFLVVLPDTEMTHAIFIAERIRKAVEHLDFYENAHITISGGLTVFQGETIVELIDIVDKKLYEAKNDGRNRIKAN